MRLTDLEPSFVRYETSDEEVSVIVGDHETWRARGCPTTTEVRPVHRIVNVDTLAEAQGIWFLCPICFAANGGKVGTHAIDVSFEGRGVKPDQGSHGEGGKPTRWKVVSGTGYQDLTLAPSIHLAGGGCGWHGWLQNGEAA